MLHKEYLDGLRAEIATMAELLEGVDTAAPVPSCPGWDVAELIRHTGLAHRWVRQIVATRATERVSWRDVPLDAPDSPVHLAAWLAAGADPLLSALDTDPATAVWSFGIGGCVGWWARRMLQETTIHRADAELACGGQPSIAPDVAVDGVEELLTIMLPVTKAGPKLIDRGLTGSTLHLHATDAPGEWTIKLTDIGFEVLREHQKATVAVRGRAADLCLLLWNRRRPDEVDRFEVFGDEKFLAVWLADTAL